MKIIIHAVIIIVLCCLSAATYAADGSTSATNDSDKAENTAITTISDSKSNESLKIANAWARPAEAAQNSAVYMTITNKTGDQVNIIGAGAYRIGFREAGIANDVELHQTYASKETINKQEVEIVRMKQLDKIVVPASGHKSTVLELAPGGIHIMLMDLKRPLISGEKYEIAIKIEGGAPIIAELTVKQGN